MIETKILEPKYSPRQALIMLLHTDPSLEIEDIEDVYYPYLRMRFQLTVGKNRRFIKQLIKYVDCIIDRVSGTAYDTIYDKESGTRPYFTEIEIDEEEALDIVMSIDDCHEKGHDFALKQYIGRAKLMFTPEFSIIEEDEFYKKFYVVTCRDKDGLNYFIMVDAVDGGISVLDHEQHIDTLAKLGDIDQLRYMAGAEDDDDEGGFEYIKEEDETEYEDYEDEE